ncbi:alpha/beta hydrolase family protein [Prevotella marseillensis]|uniref:alpha/beta hydrolase family protein n=1 Tax=Prevotella marseillensis TaxID=2479840 RepID=UPI000F6375A6|nr:CocE/NonD family hydrolase [Prevotella marseillensis]
MKRVIIPALMLLSMSAGAQTFENKFTRPLSDVLNDVSARFGIRLKYNVDTTGLKLAYADFRVRPYSLEETLNNILSPFDFKAVKQNDKLYKIKPYEYPRRQPEDGQKMISWLTSLYSNKTEWEARRDTLRKEVRERLGIDKLLPICSKEKPEYSKIRKFDGYTVQNFRLKTANGHTVCGSIYAPTSKGKHPLIICPNGHFSNGRYGKVQQLRLGTLARMGAICVDYDLWGWGESADEVGSKAHQTPEAHVMQALNGIRILDWMIQRKDVDTKRIGVNGGSGGGTQTVLLTVLDDRFTAANPVVSVSSWFDGGCPCESGMPIQLAGGGTCNAELAAMFAPKPMMLVSDGGDWTSTTPELEYPYLQRIYGFYGATDKVSNIHLPKERHDFGDNKRNAVYKFFIDTFNLDASKLDESKVTIEDENALRFTPKK